MRKDARLLDGGLSIGKMHELEALLRRFPEPRRVTDKGTAATALMAYAKDALAHSGERENQDKRVTLDELGVKSTGDYEELRDALRAAIDRILVVRSLCEWGFAP